MIKEIAERGLSLIEINPAGVSAMYRLTVDLGVGYARSSTVLDYRLAGQGSIDSNLERLVEWTGERSNDKAPRHDFGVLQPSDAAIDAIVAWRKRLQRQSGVALVPIIGHFECREACMTRVRVQPRSFVHEDRRSRVLPAECRADADRRGEADFRRPSPEPARCLADAARRRRQRRDAGRSGCRELREEVGTAKALLLRETRDWVTYDVPAELRPPYWKGRWRGQAQKWFALAFTGQDSDIDLAAHEQEFDAWRWAPAGELLETIVPWKRQVYETVLNEFSDLLLLDRALPARP